MKFKARHAVEVEIADRAVNEHTRLAKIVDKALSNWFWFRFHWGPGNKTTPT